LNEKDPFIEVEGQVAVRRGYVYKIYNLGKKKRICIRSTVHSYIVKGNEDDESQEKIYQNVYSLTEFEGNKSNWKANLDLMMA
jgi:6-pyruvoyl-tetrahydropterin synthase